MKLKKLDIRGFSHDFVMVAFVVVFAIAGVGYLVASHADSCTPVSGPMSGPTSGPASSSCNPTVSSPVSTTTKPPTPPPTHTPPAPPKRIAGTCNISGMPDSIKIGNTLKAKVTVKNTGNVAFNPKLATVLTVLYKDGSTTSKNYALGLPSIKPGVSFSQAITAYSVPTNINKKINFVQYRVVNNNGAPNFNCVARTSIVYPPKKP